MPLFHKPSFGPYQYHRLNGRSPFCAHCGKPRRTPPRARFCSPACKQRAYRRRRVGVREDYRGRARYTVPARYTSPLERYGSGAG